MKSRNDPRHQRREHLVQLLFEWHFRKPAATPTEIKDIIDRLETIDGFIKESATQWPLDQISVVDLAVLRHGVWELFYSPNPPSEKVILDESIELGKEYGGDTSPSFINGVLGSVLKKHPDLIRTSIETVSEKTEEKVV